ncbi:MAG TPA: methionyl-tRNA formyltransferase, partial [Solirubrobacterales bacterium]
MRTAYLGTSEFAAVVLRRLAGSPHRPALVVTPPDRRQGRGRKVQPPPAAIAAKELGLELLQAENVNEEGALERVRAAKPEVVIVCAFGQLIREPLLSEFPMLNVHPSLLPRWRGAAPIERAMMARDPVTGVCVMQLTAGLDSGPVALCEEVPLDPEEDFGALSTRLAELGGDLLVRALDLQ